MGRELKFRGKFQDNWCIGTLSVLKVKHGNVDAGSYISNSAGQPFAFKINPDTVGQFTGMTDRHGVEIFEHDLVEFVQGTCEALPCISYPWKLHEKGTQFSVRHLKCGFMLIPLTNTNYEIPNIQGNVQMYDFWCHARSLKVIGNIFDNEVTENSGVL